MNISLIEMEDRGCTVEVLKKLYAEDKNSATELSRQFNVSRHTIKKWIEKAGIEFRKKNPDLIIDYFETINTEEKAYWLGYAWCDGNVNVRKVGKYIEYCLSIDICERDHEHLYKFKDSTKTISKVEKLKAVEAAKTSDEWRYRIRIKNSKFCKILFEKYKMIPYRTKVGNMVEALPKHLIKHFIRGVIDADGSVILTKDSRGGFTGQISISVSDEMGMFIRRHLFDEGIVKSVAKLTPLYMGGLLDLYKISYGGNIQIVRLIEYLYVDSNVYMERKYNKAMGIIKTLKERQNVQTNK